MNLADATAAGSSEANRTAAHRGVRQLAATAPEGYATLARLREAALKADAGDLPGAAALWDRVAGDASADPLLRDLASLLWAQHQIDSGDPALLEARLKAAGGAGQSLARAGRGAACAAGPAPGQGGSGEDDAAPPGAGHHGAERRSRPGQLACWTDWAVDRHADGTRGLTRRTALLAPLALGGCGLWDDWFGTKKTPLPGKREPILAGRRTLKVDEGVPKVVLPPEVRNAAWPQAGGNPAHFMGHLAAGERLTEAWSANIGAGGGYRRKILAQPVAADGIVYVMDSDAVVSAFDVAGGGRVWRFDTRDWRTTTAPTSAAASRSIRARSTR